MGLSARQLRVRISSGKFSQQQRHGLARPASHAERPRTAEISHPGRGGLHCRRQTASDGFCKAVAGRVCVAVLAKVLRVLGWRVALLLAKPAALERADVLRLLITVSVRVDLRDGAEDARCVAVLVDPGVRGT